MTKLLSKNGGKSTKISIKLLKSRKFVTLRHKFNKVCTPNSARPPTAETERFSPSLTRSRRMRKSSLASRGRAKHYFVGALIVWAMVFQVLGLADSKEDDYVRTQQLVSEIYRDEPRYRKPSTTVSKSQCNNPEKNACPHDPSKFCRGDIYMIWSIGFSISKDLFGKDGSVQIQSAADVTDVRALFVADPFLIITETLWYIFTEVLNTDCQKGEIGYHLAAMKGHRAVW